MGAVVCLAAILMFGQTIDEKANKLFDDYRQTMTLFDSLRVKVSAEADGAKLVTQLREKLQIIAQTATKYQSEAKTNDAKARLAVIRFQALASTLQPAEQTDAIAIEIATKYRESAGLCPFIEDLTFYKILGQDRYAPFDVLLKQSKNKEVVSSAFLANYFSSTMNDGFDINVYRLLSVNFKDTKAGQRAARIYNLRTTMSLGAPMPELELELLSGYKLKIGSLKGRVVVIDFYGFWSSGSVAEMPEIRDYVSKYSNKIAWIGINTDGWTKAFLTQRLTDLGANWQNCYGGSISGTLPIDLGIVAYPSKIIIDSYGVIRYLPGIRDWRPSLDEALSKT